MRWARVLGLALMPAAVWAVASTDSLQDADPSQSGYLPNHNMDPSKLSSFTLGWRNTYNVNEKFYAKPLIWTPPGSTSEVVIMVSNQNIIRLIDGSTGTLLKTRTLDPPFQSVDTNCGDIPNTVGITGTPWIDGATNIMYLMSKGYKGGLTGSGTINGQYKFYGIDLRTLADAIPPVSIENRFANNDHTRYFVGGTLAQRPSLASVGDSIIAGFGGHCDNFNYTGMIVAVSKTAGVGVTNIMAMEVSPGAPSPQALDITVQGGGKAGIWQSGMGIATDGSRVFFVTGNGRGAGDNGGGVPADGKKGQSTLQNAAVSLNVNNGVFVFGDYFEPYEYQSLNGGDRDFGASGAALLDPMFSGGGVNRIVVSGGKSGKIYIMDADNMGGFAMGSSGTDNVIQTINQPNSLLGGIASYPAEGGYIYFCPSGDSLYAYKFGTSGSGKPVFTLAGKTALSFAGRSVPSVTSLNGAPGTALVWLSDVNQGLVAYKAIPENGVLVPIALPAVGRLQKMQRPGFGNSRVYTTSVNQVIMVGPAGTPPSFTCTPSPLSFGSVTVGQTSTVQVTCNAVGASYNLKGCTTGLGTFQCSGIPATVASGGSFTFSAVFNITNNNIEAVRQGGYQVLPGNQGAAINIISTTGATLTSIQATANVVASGGYLVAGNVQVDFGGVTFGASSAVQTVTLTNNGASALTFTSFAYQDLKVASPAPFITVTPSNPTIIGNGFTATGFPAINSVLASGAVITLSMTFKPNTVGSSSSLITFYSDGGYVDVMLVGTAAPGSSSSVAASSSTKILTSSSVKSSSAVGTSSEISSLSSSMPSSSSLPASSSSLSTSSSIPLSSTMSSSSSLLSSSDLPLSSTLSSSASLPSSSDLSSSSDLPSSSSTVEFSSLSSSSSSAASSDFAASSSTLLSSSSALVDQLTSSAIASSSDTAGIIQLTSSLPVSTSTLRSSTSSISVPTATPSKVFPPGAIVIPTVPGQPQVFAAPQGNFTDVSGNGGPLAGFIGYNITVDAINPPSQMQGIYECLGNCSSTAFGGPYTVAGVEDTTCFCANGTADTSSPGAGFVMAGSYVNGKIVPRVGGGLLFVYKIVLVSSLPDAPPAPVVSSSSTRPSIVASTTSIKSSSTLQTSSSKSLSSSIASKSSSVFSTFKSSTIAASPSKTSSLSLPTPTAPTGTYPYIGCFADTSKQHALPLLFKAKNMTPELCQSYVLSLAAKPTPTVLPYFYMEFASECYGGSSFNFGATTTVKSLTGKKACTKVCSGSINALSTGTAKCGGSKQFDLYAASGVVDFGGRPIVTTSK